MDAHGYLMARAKKNQMRLVSCSLAALGSTLTSDDSGLPKNYWQKKNTT